MNLQKELKALYDSEINVRIESFWDGEWRVALGDEMNGFKRPRWDFRSLDQVALALRELALEHYPNSTYSRKLKQKRFWKLVCAVVGHAWLYMEATYKGELDGRWCERCELEEGTRI